MDPDPLQSPCGVMVTCCPSKAVLPVQFRAGTLDHKSSRDMQLAQGGKAMDAGTRKTFESYRRFLRKQLDLVEALLQNGDSASQVVRASKPHVVSRPTEARGQRLELIQKILADSVRKRPVDVANSMLGFDHRPTQRRMIFRDLKLLVEMQKAQTDGKGWYWIPKESQPEVSP